MPRSATRRIQIELPIHLTITLEDDRAAREHAYNTMLADIVESVERIGTQYYLRPERGEAITARIADECDILDLDPAVDAPGDARSGAAEGRGSAQGPHGQAARGPAGAHPSRPGARSDVRRDARGGQALTRALTGRAAPGRTGRGTEAGTEADADRARPRLFLVRDDVETGAKMGDHARGVDRRPAPKPRRPRGKSA